jgi:hypothetical protein
MPSVSTEVSITEQFLPQYFNKLTGNFNMADDTQSLSFGLDCICSGENKTLVPLFLNDGKP